MTKVLIGLELLFLLGLFTLPTMSAQAGDKASSQSLQLAACMCFIGVCFTPLGIIISAARGNGRGKDYRPEVVNEYDYSTTQTYEVHNHYYAEPQQALPDLSVIAEFNDVAREILAERDRRAYNYIEQAPGYRVIGEPPAPQPKALSQGQMTPTELPDVFDCGNGVFYDRKSKFYTDGVTAWKEVK